MKSWYSLLTVFLTVSTLLLATASADTDVDYVDSYTDLPTQQPSNSSTSQQSNSTSKRHVLVVTGMVEHYTYLSSGSTDKLLDLAGIGDEAKQTFIRLTGWVACLDKEAGNWRMTAPVKGTAREVRFTTSSSRPGANSYSTISSMSSTYASVSEEGSFVIHRGKKPEEPDSEQYLTFTHNCTDSGETTNERFDLSLFAQHQREPYTILSQGYGFYPVSSHDTVFTREIAEMFAYSKYFSKSTKKSVPETVFVEGETDGGSYNPAGIRVVGRLYNWDYESMPETVDDQSIDEAFINSTKVPLTFDGRVQVKMGENGTCNGVKLALHRGGRKVMSGATHSADGPFRMYAEDGGLLELMEPLSDWLLVVEHTCNKEWALRTQKFHLTPNKRSGPNVYYETAKLEPLWS